MAHKARTCEVCSADYRPTYPHQRTCGRKCGHDLKRFVTGTMSDHRKRGATCRVYFPDCSECGRTFCARGGRTRTCGVACRAKRNSRSICERYAADAEYRDHVLAMSHARRADKLGLGKKSVLLSYLVVRDHGQCQIPACLFPRRRVDEVGSRGPRKPSIDHIVPLSKGGEHELANVQLAHDKCNRSKNNRGAGDQLALIG